MYSEQIKSVQSQVPAIQKLYQTLTQGLQSQYDTNLATGVQSINEDASARGVLRSTLPNDARASLTGQLGAALQQSLGQLGQQQASDISNINQQVGQLRISQASSVADLARALETQDLERQRFALDKLNSERDYRLKQQQLAQSAARSSGGGGGYGGTSAPSKASLLQQLQGDVAAAFNSKNAKQNFYTEKTVLPALYTYYGSLGNDVINKAVYQYRKNALGF